MRVTKGLLGRMAAVGATMIAAAGCTEPAVGGSGCRASDCVAQCADAGLGGGTCVGDMCQCGMVPDGGGDADADGGADDAGEIEGDPCAPPTCGPEELCGETTFGDGVDNDCDTSVDEGCECEGMGVTMECFAGDPVSCPRGEPCVGECVRGVQRCTEFLMWGPCTGYVGPSEERCDGADNNCNGLVDEEIPRCDSPVVCPSARSAPPMSWVQLDGAPIFPTSFDSWEWRIICPTTIPADMCPVPEDPASRTTRVFFVASGTYRARATIRVGDDTYTCEFAVLVKGEGLRVELTWDTQGSAHGNTDVDLHLHKWGSTLGFFNDSTDCYFPNCTASDYLGGGGTEWGLPNTPDVSVCANAPHGEGAIWRLRGYCHNPRLDVDVIRCTTGVTNPMRGDYCAPENINVDNPPLGQPMRIMVNYYSDHGYSGVTNATVNVYCGGALRATFGPQPLVSGSSIGEPNDNWLVADVQFGEGACGALDCRIVPILDDSGNPVVQRRPDFGPPWSTF